MSARKPQIFVSHNSNREMRRARAIANASATVSTEIVATISSVSISPEALAHLGRMVSRSHTIEADFTQAARKGLTPPVYWTHRAPLTVRTDPPAADRMENVASWLSILGKSTRRTLEETIADYRFEYDEAVGQGANAEALKRINRTHWGGFFSVVLRSLWGIFERVLKAWKSAR